MVTAYSHDPMGWFISTGYPNYPFVRLLEAYIGPYQGATFGKPTLPELHSENGKEKGYFTSWKIIQLRWRFSLVQYQSNFYSKEIFASKNPDVGKLKWVYLETLLHFTNSQIIKKFSLRINSQARGLEYFLITLFSICTSTNFWVSSIPWERNISHRVSSKESFFLTKTTDIALQKYVFWIKITTFMIVTISHKEFMLISYYFLRALINS